MIWKAHHCDSLQAQRHRVLAAACPPHDEAEAGREAEQGRAAGGGDTTKAVSLMVTQAPQRGDGGATHRIPVVAIMKASQRVVRIRGK